MSINKFKVKKWIKMLVGKSEYHVNQDEGKIYSKEKIEGYYNNLTEKVTKYGYPLGTVPKTIVDNEREIYFPIAIFQYGLASYDLYLINKDKEMLKNVYACANWAIDNQDENGGWITFKYKNISNKYSSMAQGEGISLLIRTYLISKDHKYIDKAKRALEFMLKPISEGGTAEYQKEDIYLYESPEEPLVLNGWIFSIWGILDYYKFFKDDKSKRILEQSIKSLVKKLPDFDIKYWSKYEDGKRICSPFYHRLHIYQLMTMYKLTDIEIFKEYSEKWEKYESNRLFRLRAFIKKTKQKIFEK